MLSLMTFEANLKKSANSNSILDEGVSRDEFREAMSRVGSAVHIVTTGGDAGRAGLTATAFSAVSDAPPLVLVCVNGASRSHGIILKNKTFCVNTLAAGSDHLADLFAGRVHDDPEVDKFQGLDTMLGVTGSPVLPNALAAIDCVITQQTEMGTHTVFFGSVRNVVLGPELPGLIYRERAYRSV